MSLSDSEGQFWETIFDVGSTFVDVGRAFYYESKSLVALAGGDLSTAARYAEMSLNAQTDILIDVGSTFVPFLAAPVAKLGAEEIIGGTYKLLDDAGNVSRTGRTNDLLRRQTEHARSPETKNLRFKVDQKTDDYAQQRGREQIIHDQHPEARIENGGLNKQNPISKGNPNRQDYLDSAKDL